MFQAHGRVMLDPLALIKMKPMNQLIPHLAKAVPEEKLGDDEMMLRNSKIFGFSLTSKKWGKTCPTQPRPEH